MGTVVTIRVIRSRHPLRDIEERIAKAFDWFHEVEERCSRFSPDSELMELSATVATPFEASPVLFETVRFAVLAAEESNGVFDPTLGRRMETLGFNRNYATGAEIRSTGGPAPGVTYRDVGLDPEAGTITLKRPMTLDLGAVAKGFAIDLAVRELQPLRDFAVDAGGDLFLGGRNAQGRPWSVGIRHPRQDGALIDTLYVSGQAVCTSGDYERNGPAGHHLIDPRTGASARASASATVVAPGAMLADVLATTAFIMGPEKAVPFLEQMDVEGLLISADLNSYETKGLRRGR